MNGDAQRRIRPKKKQPRSAAAKGGFVNYNMKKTSLICVYNTLSGIFFNKD